MSWSFFHIKRADEIAKAARHQITDGYKMSDGAEENIRKNALEIIATVAEAMEPAQAIKVQASGSMYRQDPTPARYSLKIEIETSHAN